MRISYSHKTKGKRTPGNRKTSIRSGNVAIENTIKISTWPKNILNICIPLDVCGNTFSSTEFQISIKLGPVPRDASPSLEHTKCACRKAFIPRFLHSPEGGRNPQKLKHGKNKKTSSKVLMLPKSKEMCWWIKCQHQTDFLCAIRQMRWTEEVCSTHIPRKLLKILTL